MSALLILVSVVAGPTPGRLSSSHAYVILNS